MGFRCRGPSVLMDAGLGDGWRNARLPGGPARLVRRGAALVMAQPPAWRRRAWRHRCRCPLLLLPLALLLGACTNASRREASPVLVVTTALPLTLFSRAVAGDCAEVQPLIPEGLDPHDVQARPADLLLLRRARVLVRNGLGLDDYVTPWIAAAAARDLRVVDTSAGVAALPADVDGSASHSPGEAGHGEAGHGDAGHSHSHGPLNPHIWLDPRRAEQQLNAIRDALVQADPACAAAYRRNASAYAGQLRQLDQQIAAALAPYRGRTLVAYHDVAPYFAARYGLRAEAVVAKPGQPPAPAALQRLHRTVQSQGLRALLAEPPKPSPALQALARDLGLQLLLFDPLETASPQAADDPNTYFTVMRRNALAVRGVFAGS